MKSSNTELMKCQYIFQMYITHKMFWQQAFRAIQFAVLVGACESFIPLADTMLQMV